MRRRYLLLIASMIAIGLGTCTTLLQPSTGQPPQASSIDISKACADWRWIGIMRKPGGACPEIPGWKESPLFGRNYPRQYSYGASSREIAEVVEELKRFCVYEAEGPQTQGAPPARAEFVRFDRDCAALATSAPPRLEAVTRKPLATHFLSQVIGPAETVSAVGGPPAVRLAFVDSQPSSQDFPTRSGRSRHGYTLAHIARRLVCGKEGCAAKITTQLALRVTHFDPLDQDQTTIVGDELDKNGRGGGSVGTLSDLAAAIKNEVVDWQDHDPALHLVLNLSVAWDGDLFGGLSEERVCEMPAGVQAVYHALEYASRHGALVLAAAGNRQYGPYPSPYPKSGPLLPAAWEGRREEEGCGRPRNRPLLYAVGGVQSEGWPLANARIGGLPRRVAYADHAVVDSLDPREPTAVYTGSSVATAVVSSIAAVVWKTRPRLDAHELMEILDASGDVRPFPANFWFGGPVAPPVHQLSLCSALEAAACDPDSPTCQERARSRCGRTSERPLLSDLLTFSRKKATDGSELVDVTRPCLATRMIRHGGSSSPPLCPSDRFFGITSQPWLFSQPGDTPCPNCVIVPPRDDGPRNIALAANRSSSPSPEIYILHGVIREDWPGGCLTDATLDIERFDPPDSTTRRISVDFGRSYCSAGETFVHEIRMPGDVQLDERTTVTLGFVVQEPGVSPTTSHQSPVLVAR